MKARLSHKGEGHEQTKEQTENEVNEDDCERQGVAAADPTFESTPAESSSVKCRSRRPDATLGKPPLRKPGILALAAQVLAREMCSLSSDEILDEIMELASKSPRVESISSADLDYAIKCEIEEKGERSRFVHHVETDEFEISSFGDELDSAAFFEANAKSRYIVMREDGRTPEQIRIVAAFAEQEALIELCEGVIAGTRKEPEDPTYVRPSKKDANIHLKAMLRVEDTRINPNYS